MRFGSLSVLILSVFISTRVFAIGFGFGSITSGGGDKFAATHYPIYQVTNYSDNTSKTSGSLRGALLRAKDSGGGIIEFNIAAKTGTITLTASTNGVPSTDPNKIPLEIPANTTVDTGIYHVTIMAQNVTKAGGRGAFTIYSSNVILRNFKIRNSGNDGVQIAAKSVASGGHGDISRIIVDRLNVENCNDGGIDLSGLSGYRVSNVTVSSNYLAANGWCRYLNTPGHVDCSGTTSDADGGAMNLSPGVGRVSIYHNFFDKNLRRNPQVDGTAAANYAFTDIKYNHINSPFEKGAVKIRNNAKANVYLNYFSGTFGQGGPVSGNMYWKDTSSATYYGFDRLQRMDGTLAIIPGVDLSNIFALDPDPLSDNYIMAWAGTWARDAKDNEYLQAQTFIQAKGIK